MIIKKNLAIMITNIKAVNTVGIGQTTKYVYSKNIELKEQ